MIWLKMQPTIEDVLPKFIEFIGDQCISCS